MRLIFVDQSNPSQTARKGTWLLSQMTSAEKQWVSFLIEKSKAFAVFKNFKIHVEKETNSFIKALWTDIGGEHTSQEFTNFCDVNGIQKQLIAAYTSQENEFAEKKNKTIMNMVLGYGACCLFIVESGKGKKLYRVKLYMVNSSI